MEIRKVRAHHCFQKNNPQSPIKCRCRQWIPVSEAKLFVERGLAKQVIVALRIEPCRVCGNDDVFKKTCSCGGLGHAKVPVYGEDIIFISRDGKKNNKTVKVKKSPTIEKAHIERAYTDNKLYDQVRIEAYGDLNRQFIHSLISGTEPEDDRRKGTGRRYDYGRTI